MELGRSPLSGIGLGMDQIERLQDAIKRLHGCDAKHLHSTPVMETFQGRIVWDGYVEVFALIGHAKAQTCYAWIQDQGHGEERYFAVLGTPPINTAREAVRAMIVSEFRHRRT
jgi:hypothetical protein